MEDTIKDFSKKTATQQLGYIQDKPIETLRIIWYLIGYSGILRKAKKEEANDKETS